MLCANCHQKQVIHHILLQNRRNLHMAWTMLPDAGGTFLTKHCVAMAWFPHELVDSATYCIRYSRVSELGNTGDKGPSHSRTIQKMPSLNHVSDQKWEAAFEKNLDPTAGSPAAGKSMAGIINLFVDDLFGTGGNEMEQRVLTRLWKDFQVGSEDWNDVAFTGQRIRWTQDSQNGPYIEVNQNKAIEELEEIPVERNTKEDLHCTLSMNTMYRSLLGQINWLQSWTQFQCCYKFSRCASMAASPTFGDVKSLKKIGETDQVTASKASTLATHSTIENTWISWCFLPKQRWWLFTKRHDSVHGRIDRAIFKGWNVIWEFGRPWKSED